MNALKESGRAGGLIHVRFKAGVRVCRSAPVRAGARAHACSQSDARASFAATNDYLELRFVMKAEARGLWLRACARSVRKLVRLTGGRPSRRRALRLSEPRGASGRC